MLTCATPAAYQLLHDGSLALADVEHHGIRVDVPYLQASIKKTENLIAEIEVRLKADEVWKTWKRRFGSKAKLGNDSQLATVLFKEMGLAEVEYTDATEARVKGNEATLSRVNLPFVKDFLRRKKLIKAKSTYLEGILSETVGDRLHPAYNLNIANTYRSSSNLPNFQNFPIRNPEMGKLIRQAFIPTEGNYLAEVDFSGIEVRVAYCYHRDPTMEKYLRGGGDMHHDEAMSLFLLKHDEVTKKGTRDAAKNMWVFPQFYGSVYFQCAPHIWEAMERRDFRVGEKGITVREHLASKGITGLGKCSPESKPVPGTFEYLLKQAEDNLWNRRFPVYAQWRRSWWRKYQEEGGFQTLTGFYCRWGKEGVLKRNDAINYPVQGAAFHCLLWALTRLNRWLKKHNMRSRIVGQIHDSILLDIYPPELQDVLATAKYIMTVEVPRHWDWICIGLDVEADVVEPGQSWHDKKEWSTDGEGTWGPKKKAA